jgi:hypothetical protein
MKRKDEYMISGIGGKGGVFFLFLAAPPFLFLFLFYLIGNHNPYFPTK